MNPRVSLVPASSFEVHRLGEIDSTNEWLLAAARGGAPDRTVAVAEFQRRGRGRLDRRWEAPAGSALLSSVLLRVALDAPDRHLATVAVGLAAVEGCRAVRTIAVGLKWPNDLVVGGCKLGGILAETDGSIAADGSTAIVVGLGVNLTWPGPSEANGTSILQETGDAVGRDELLDAYLGALSDRADQLCGVEGRDALVRDYLDELVTIGQAVRVEQPDGVVEGVASGITDQGHLVIATAQGLRVVTVGDVVHLRTAGSGPPGPRE